MAFLEADLNVSQAELDEIKTTLANTGENDPFPNALAENEQMVRDWTARYIVPEATLKRLWRPLVLFRLYGLIGNISKALEKLKDDAMDELKAIRDGKFTNYPAANPQPSGFSTTSGKWGSKERIE